MSPLVLCLLGTLPACGTGVEEDPVRVGLYADFQNEPAASVRDIVHEELAAILAPLGMALEWRSLATSQRNDSWTRLAIVHFKGRCDLSDLTTYPPYAWVLGRTHVSDGEIIPFSDIYCNAIRAFLAPTLASMDPNNRTLAFGRAVGRVLAHELYHVLANTRRHASGGLGEAFYSARELAADEFRFGDKEAQRLQMTIAPPPKSAIRSVMSACQGSGP